MRTFRVALALTLLLSASQMYAQRSVSVFLRNFAISSGTYSFDIWGRRTNPGTGGANTVLVGTSSFYINYNGAALATPVLSNINPRFTGPSNHSGDYDPMYVLIVAGRIAVTVSFLGNLTGIGAALDTTNPIGERLCSVNLSITDPSAMSQLSWDIINSAITDSRGVPVDNSFVGVNDTLLPVQLMSFTGSIRNGEVHLQWRTASELNNYGFEVQKSQSANNGFQTIPNSFIAGHGTTNQPHSYSYVDRTTSTGVWYYRLKQMDLDGTVHFTDPITVESTTSVSKPELPKVYALEQNYPNPFNPATTIDFALPKSSHVKLEVFNTLGQRVAEMVNETRETGYYSERLDASQLATGVYIYRLQAGDFAKVRKLLVLK